MRWRHHRHKEQQPSFSKHTAHFFNWRRSRFGIGLLYAPPTSGHRRKMRLQTAARADVVRWVTFVIRAHAPTEPCRWWEALRSRGLADGSMALRHWRRWWGLFQRWQTVSGGRFTSEKHGCHGLHGASLFRERLEDQTYCGLQGSTGSSDHLLIPKEAI